MAVHERAVVSLPAPSVGRALFPRWLPETLRETAEQGVVLRLERQPDPAPGTAALVGGEDDLRAPDAEVAAEHRVAPVRQAGQQVGDGLRGAGHDGRVDAPVPGR